MDDWDNGYLDGLLRGPIAGETENYLEGFFLGGMARVRMSL